MDGFLDDPILARAAPSAQGGAPYARQAMAFVLAGGRGSRLHELTDRRAKPALNFGGKFRIIDFALSNALNSGIRRIAVATQYQGQSLIRHLHRGWSFLRPERNETFDILPASQRVSEENWYQGTADAVFQNLDIIREYGSRFIVVLAGDHVYKMDFEPMLRQHAEQGADVTVACVEVPRAQASGFGVMAVAAGDRIVDFVEKPADPPALPWNPDVCLASMGVYVFDTEFLTRELLRDAVDSTSSHDFGKDIIPGLVARGRAVAHPLIRSCVRSGPDGPAYWRDVGSIDSYFAANLDLTDVVPDLDLYDRTWPIWTYAETMAPAKFVHDEPERQGRAIASLVASGCVLSGASVRRSLLFQGVRVNSYSTLERAVVLPRVQIGRSVRLTDVIVDSDVCIPDGLVVGEDPAEDARRFRRSEGGVCLITQKRIDQLSP
jgi:glucose-1-phosphate adenylyltransferase